MFFEKKKLKKTKKLCGIVAAKSVYFAYFHKFRRTSKNQIGTF